MDNAGIEFKLIISNVSGNQNTAVGIGALYCNTNGNDNATLGYHAPVNSYNK